MKSGGVTVALLLATSLVGVARLQPRLARAVHEVKAGSDVYLLPPPSELRVMSLGYHAAAADGMWAKLIVEYGTHWAEKRAWSDANKYMEAILAFDPQYPLVYKYAETLIMYHPPVGTLDDFHVAVAMLERGTRERPYDADVWLNYGQLLAFASTTWVKDGPALSAYRAEGARAIVHAVELGADPDRSISAATLLSRYGQRDAAIRELERAYALADDDLQRVNIAQKLAVLDASPDKDEIERTMRTIEARWRDEFNFLARDAYLLLGPITSPFRCAGRAADGCPRSWNDVVDAR